MITFRLVPSYAERSLLTFFIIVGAAAVPLVAALVFAVSRFGRGRADR